jgi:hypothetical protein
MRSAPEHGKTSIESAANDRGDNSEAGMMNV